MNLLIVGAAGNLGSLLTNHLLPSAHLLRLLMHTRGPPFDLAQDANVEVVQADLDDPASLHPACVDIDCIIYLAGVLFQPRAEKFIHRTNTIYVQNIVGAALAAGVKKFILVSFPHVEGSSTPDAPAKGSLDCQPTSLHGRTRLEAEKYLFQACQQRTMTPIVLRAGVIYGSDVKLIKAARWLMRWRLMAIWRAPTWVHLLSLPDFLSIVGIAIETNALSGIYNLCDDQPLFLQEFLDRLAGHWNYAKPHRFPDWSFYAAAALCESFATVFHTATPLTADILRMGMTSVVADTSRMKSEIVGELRFPTLTQGLAIL